MIFPVASRKTTWRCRSASLKAFFPLMTPVIIMGGILGGIFTLTEAAGRRRLRLLIGLFVMRTLRISDLGGIFQRSAMTSAVVLLCCRRGHGPSKTVVSLSHAPEILANINWLVRITR